METYQEALDFVQEMLNAKEPNVMKKTTKNKQEISTYFLLRNFLIVKYSDIQYNLPQEEEESYEEIFKRFIHSLLVYKYWMH